MSTVTATETEIDDLLARLRAADEVYFNSGSESIPDPLYDSMREQLRVLAPDHPYLETVGAPASEKLKKVKHSIPMGSLNKAMSVGEFMSWVQHISKACSISQDDLVFTASYKADGGSYSGEFKKCQLVRAVTRGDGKVGEDVTKNGRCFKGLPVDTNSGFVRFEGVLSNQDWAILDPDTLSNPRNLANGIGRRADAKNADSITAVCFQLYDSGGNLVGNSEAENLISLGSAGANVVPFVTGDYKLVLDFFANAAMVRNMLPFWIDGIVVKVNDFKLRDRLVSTDPLIPRWAIAIKFEPETATTRITDIVMSVGHTGAIIPTAKFESVRLGGTSVSSALLANWNVMESLDIAIGDTVKVYKAGEIIPKILEVTQRPADRRIVPKPTTCPVCGCPVEVKQTLDGETSAGVFCVNEQCPSRVTGKLMRFLRAVEIDGIGPEILEALVCGNGVVRCPGDLYRLVNVPEKLAELPLGNGKVGLARATTICANIKQKSKLTIDQLLGSLGIEGLGTRRVAAVRAKMPGQFDTLDDWLSGKLLQLASVIGLPRSAVNIHIGVVKAAPVIRDMLAAGVEMLEPVTTSSPALKAGAKSFCITGTLSRPRATIEDSIRKAGHEVRSAVTKTLDYLVMADPTSGSSKALKASDIGVKCISEKELDNILTQNN